MFTVHRYQRNPILSPDPSHPWEAAAAFNGCPIKVGRVTHLLYRAMSHPELLAEPRIPTSIIGKATSTNGTTYGNREPFIVPEEAYERYGCEDPRVTKFEGRYYIFYTALSGFPFGPDNIKTAVAISDDLETIAEKHLVTPFNAKALSLFPERINGKICILLTVDTDRPHTKIAIAELDTIEELWSPDFWNEWYQHIDDFTLIIPHDDNEQVEIGSTPIKTKKGWLLLYSHIQEYRTGTPIFGIQSILLDLTSPRKIIGNTGQPFMVPELFYEKIGTVSRIIFPSGALIHGDMVDIYYGGSDTHCCRASVHLEQLLNAMEPNYSVVHRFEGNPILSARPSVAWEAHGVFNPAAIDLDGTIHLLYRAMSSDDTSTFGWAASLDGLHITDRSAAPVYLPRGLYENKQRPGNSGCEDPRVVLIGETVYLFYTAYDGTLPRVAVSTLSKKDFLKKRWDKWSEPMLVTPPSIDNKDGCIIPGKTKNGYVMLHRIDTTICADIFHSLDFSKEKVTRCIELLLPRRGMWDGRKVGISAPPLKTKKGWLLLYHGVAADNVYSVGAALLDLVDPTAVLARTALPLFTPEAPYEINGVMRNVVFPCGMVKRNDTLYIYYGAADMVTAVATAKLSTVLKLLS
ncbi:MAG TPA: hypothetical protein VG621_02475 [Candidatus Paceibacterota bacterium]|nr:hypothetical protein [Candidatus Paceibacterota bacterium]